MPCPKEQAVGPRASLLLVRPAASDWCRHLQQTNTAATLKTGVNGALEPASCDTSSLGDWPNPGYFSWVVVPSTSEGISPAHPHCAAHALATKQGIFLTSTMAGLPFLGTGIRCSGSTALRCDRLFPHMLIKIADCGTAESWEDCPALRL
ncbi:unnamed protein product [Lepidochelys kempii]